MSKEIRDTKQAIIIRRDLKCRHGKEIAQGSHASMAFLTKQLMNGSDKVILSEEARLWMAHSFTKVCLKVNSEEELLKVYQNALDAGLAAHIITDAGRTEFAGVPTKTCVAIGPNYSEDIDKITGHLSLY